MAISTYKVFLMKKADSGEQWSKLIDIKEFPDLGGEPEMLETTTLSDNMQTYIAGIQSLVHLHGCDSGALFSGDYRPLNGCRAAQFWEQRGVHIDAAVLRRMDKLAGKYLSVGDDYRKLCIE